MSLSVQYVAPTTTPDFAGYNAFILDATSDSFTFTLPDASIGDGLNYQVKRTDSTGHIITIQGYSSSQKIDGLVTRQLHNNDALAYFVSFGSNWYRF